MKRNKYFGEEYAFEFIWLNADREGIWRGDAAELAAEFEVSEARSGHIHRRQLAGEGRSQRKGI
jgi:hypothetical protein